jgi:peptidoglycan/LPS O-acetylase OafA/YrhL
LKEQRFGSLDGLRGIAALSVVLFHFFSAYVPKLLPEQVPDPWRGSDTPFAIFYNGGFAVSVFFVLSGFVIANSASKRHLPILFNLLSRYFRLAVPVLAGTLFGWALLALSPNTVAQLKAAENHAWLNWVYDGQEPGLLWAIEDGLAGVFIHGNSMFDNVLWTMKIELLGSLAIYLLYGLVGTRHRVLVLIAAGFLSVIGLRKPEFAAFAIGALMREAYVGDRLSSRLVWPAFAFGILFGAMMEGYGDRLGLGHLPRMLALGEPHQVWHVIAATAILYSVLMSSGLKRVLSAKPARFLGDISFGLYLIHVPLLYTLFVPFYLKVQNSFLGMAGLLGIFLVCSVAVGFLFTLLIDKPTVAFIRRAQSSLPHSSQGRIQTGVDRAHASVASKANRRIAD